MAVFLPKTSACQYWSVWPGDEGSEAAGGMESLAGNVDVLEKY